MSDWDFLHEMHQQGYSAADISDAAAVGYAPWQARYIDFGDEPKEQKHTKNQQKSPVQTNPEEQKTNALQAMEMLRQAGILTRSQFLECKAVIKK